MSDDKTPQDAGAMFIVEPQPPLTKNITIHGEDGREAKIDFGGESVIYSGELPVDESAKKFFEAFHHMLKIEANKDLRQLLWLRHGCSITSLYGDDGEMQCNKCLIDFKRDDPEDIKKRFVHLGLDKAKKEIQDGR